MEKTIILRLDGIQGNINLVTRAYHAVIVSKPQLWG
jgi:hypothetical protein